MKLLFATAAFFVNAMLTANAQNPDCGVYYDKGSNNYNCCMDSYCLNAYSHSGWDHECNADEFCVFDTNQGRCIHDTPFSFSCVHYGKGKGKGYYPSKGKGYYPAPSKGKGYYSPIPISKGKGYTAAVVPSKGKGYDSGKGKGAEPYADKCYGFNKNKCSKKSFCGWDPYYYKCYDLYPPVGKGKGKGEVVIAKGKGKGAEPYAEKCYGFNKNKCLQKSYCGWDKTYYKCYDLYPPAGKGKGKGEVVIGKGKGKGAEPYAEQCYGYNKNKCKNRSYCAWDPYYYKCYDLYPPAGKGKGKGKGKGTPNPTPNPTPSKGKGKGGTVYECYGLRKKFCKMYTYCKWDSDYKICKDKKSNNVVKCDGLKKNKCKDAINCKWQPNKHGNRVCMDRKHW